MIERIHLEKSKTGTWGTHEERKYGTEVPARAIDHMMTNLDAAGELGRAQEEL